jgi:hypothetical protein
VIRDGVFDGATGGVSKPLDEKAVRCCDRWRLKSLSLVLSLLFNPALSQPNLVRAEAVPPISRGQTRLSGVGPTSDSYSGLRELVRASGRPFLLPGRPLSAPAPLSVVGSSVLGGQMVVLAAESGWGLSRSVMPGGWGFYLALVAPISAS